jgi:hypothetical protein
MIINDLYNNKKQGMAEGSLEANTPNPVVVVQDLKGKILDKVNLSMAVQKYKLGNPQDIKNQLAHQNYTQIGNYIIVSPMSGQPQDATTQGVAEGSLNEFAVEPSDGGDDDEYDLLVKLVKMWWLGDEHQHVKAEKTLASMGISIDEDDPDIILRRGTQFLTFPMDDFQQGVAEASLGDYRKKAALSKATSQIDKFFGRDDPEKVAHAEKNIAKRERGLARADARVRPYTPPTHDAEKYQRDLTAKYPNIDELVAQAEKRRDPYYDRAEGNAYYRGREAEQNYQRLKQIQRVIQGLNESLNRSHLP